MEPSIVIKKIDSSRVTIRVSWDNFNTEWECSSVLPIGKVVEIALENFYSKYARYKMSKFTNQLMDGGE